MITKPKDRVDAYLHTVDRMEPDITPVDLTAAAASIAISLKRIADSLETLASVVDHGNSGSYPKVRT